MAMACESKIIIDPEFSGLIQPLSDQERAGLEQNLLEYGCLDPLVVWSQEQILLDGHNRKEICERHGIDYQIRQVELPDRDAAKLWIIRHQLGRRNITPYQRAELALMLESVIAEKAKENQRHGQTAPGKPGTLLLNSVEALNTQKELAEIAGVGHDTIAKAKFIANNADERTKENLRAGKTTIHAEYKKLRKARGRQEKEDRKGARPVLEDRPWRLIECDIADAAGHIQAESVDWIITDPPYPKEYLGLYDHLASLADHALKPGGSLIAMVGQSYLPQIIASLSGRLDYHWTLAYLTPGGQSSQLWARCVNTFWKPLLWFTKGKYSGQWVGDVCRSDSNDNDKRFHHWGQSVSGMADIIERMTDPGQTILDPFSGGGTTGVAAVRLGRRFVGLDVNADCIATANERLLNVMEENANE